MVIYYLPKAYNVFTDDLACAQQETPNSNILLKMIAMIITGVLLIEVLYRLLCKIISGSSSKQPVHPMFNEFLKRVFLAAVIVIKGLYNPYFSLISLAMILAFTPISWTLPKSLRFGYAVILAAAGVQILRQYYSWDQFADEYMTEAICAEHSNWHYFYSFVVGGSFLSSIEILGA